MAQDAKFPPKLTTNGCSLRMVHTFIYLRLTISSSLYLNAEVSSRIAKATSIMPNWTGECEATTTWQRTPNFTYTRPVYSSHFYMAGRPRQHTLVKKRGSIASISITSGEFSIFSLQDRVTNIQVFKCTDIPGLFTILSQRHLRWLGHACQMDSGHTISACCVANLVKAFT